MTKPRFFAISVGSFRGRGSRLRVEGARGSIGREARGGGSGTVVVDAPDRRDGWNGRRGCGYSPRAWGGPGSGGRSAPTFQDELKMIFAVFGQVVLRLAHDRGVVRDGMSVICRSGSYFSYGIHN